MLSNYVIYIQSGDSPDFELQATKLIAILVSHERNYQTLQGMLYDILHLLQLLSVRCSPEATLRCSCKQRSYKYRTVLEDASRSRSASSVCSDCLESCRLRLSIASAIDNISLLVSFAITVSILSKIYVAE